MIFLPILALFSPMITDLILVRHWTHSLSHLICVIEFSYTVSNPERFFSGFLFSLERLWEKTTTVYSTSALEM